MVRMMLNGVEQEFDGDGETPLLWYLRDELGLTGTKYGCGIGACGACTVHVDGNPTFACLTTVSMLEGSQVTTIEGLSKNGDHPVQVAWRDLNVAQCGYCQAGQIMQAASLVDQSDTVTDEDIDTAMNGNLCRCGTYPRIRAAIKQAAEAS
ncbi:(2Fe-2S)-binding protein [Aurantimonas endophytica]|uniref:Isoquinoline 1-oxidoreductase alpha subunit n=1 Tax=Aurantimonas endophytica TaxID=1522175 RepID=A0A7W6HG76_9HYPH|nr:(2Fe-2S)-binding protein [Aurantimonas endophytica]MBB4004641.1 isoquinoline 1-oxidoreductase alpha subunit [Aurantimonas endophytica]MCO6405471.1 2Fe-2S iron-sulfur cluster binding domain-containing protein [Aurantimonas endophytica]